MPRPPDKPGTYRIKETPDGKWRVSGVRGDGERVRDAFRTELEAREFSERTFSGYTAPIVQRAPVTEAPPTDEWGVPIGGASAFKVTPDIASGVNATLGLPTFGPNGPTKPSEILPPEKKKEIKNRSDSLAGFVGLGWAAGTVIVGKKVADAAGKDTSAYKPNPKQMNDLADSVKDTIASWFGDREIKPWQMALLLTIAIPTTMLIQCPNKPPESLPSGNLKSVP